MANDLLNRLLHNPQPRPNLLPGNRQRRQEPQAPFPSRNHQHPTLSRRSEDLRCPRHILFRQLHTQDKAQTTDLCNHIREFIPEGLEARGEEGGFLLNALLQVRRGEPRDDVVCDAAGKRVAAKGGAMVARLDRRGDAAGDDGGADGEAVAEGFGGGEDVRVVGGGFLRAGEVPVGVCPEGARAGETALDLVVDEHGADLVAAAAQGVQELGRCEVDAAFALDGFDDYTAGLLGDEVVELLNVVEFAVFESRDYGRERRLVFRVGGCGQSAHGPSVEGIAEGDNLVLCARGVDGSAILAREFDRRFVGFGAGVGDEDLLGVLHAAGLHGGFHKELAEGSRPSIVV